MGHPLNLKVLIPNGTMTVVFLRGRNVRSPVLIGRCSKALWELIKVHYVFPSEYEECGKRATILTIGRALRRFRHVLNKFYVQPGVSPFNRFGFITPTEWNTFKELHTTPEAMACNNRMKELTPKIKFKHRVGPGGYKTAIPLWTKKEQELCEARIWIPLKVARCAQETGSEDDLI
jgi:hypothetical protein